MKNGRSPIPKSRQRIAAGLLAVAIGTLIVFIIVIANRGELNRYFGLLAWIPFGDKLGHFFLMGVLSLLVNLSLGSRRIQIGVWRVLLGSIVVSILVTGEELSQAFLPYRTLSINDWLADMAGILVFGRLACWIQDSNRAGSCAADITAAGTPEHQND